MKLLNVISRLFGSRSAPTSVDSGRNGALSYFLILFDPKSQEVVSEQTFESAADANEALGHAEAEHGDQNDLQVVMFAAHSIESVKSTHPHYFKGSKDKDVSDVPVPV